MNFPVLGQKTIELFGNASREFAWLFEECRYWWILDLVLRLDEFYIGSSGKIALAKH